jgi:CRISPR type III-A-associated protein Csm2
MDEVQSEVTQTEAAEAEAKPAEISPQEAPGPEAAKPEPAKQEPAKQAPPRQEGQRPQGPRREDRPPREGGARPGGGGGENRGPRPDNRGGERGRDDRRPGDRPGDRGGDRRDTRPGGGRPFEGPPEIELEKLISDSLYLDNQAHVVVARMRDMDSGTKSQLRRLYNAVRRAVRAPESERQHQFVMLRARLAYTIARHSLRSLDALERLLLQVTRKNDVRGYERFKDLFEAIVAYNE